MHYMTVDGVGAYSDASGYFVNAFDLIQTGAWSVLGSWRPLASAMRQTIITSAGYSFSATLILQAVLIACAMFWSVRLIALSRGFWAGLAYLAFLLILVRPFLPSMMTEPLGFMWSLVAITLIAESIRLACPYTATLGWTALFVALYIRMGSLFTLPLLALWLILGFARRRTDRIRIAVLAASCGAAVVALNQMMNVLYGAKSAMTGGNFAHVACGLARNTNWAECATAFSSELAALPDQAAVSMFLYRKAWESFVSNPNILFSHLINNMYSFVEQFPRFLIQGYVTLFPQSLPAGVIEAFVAAVVVGFGVSAWRGRLKAREIAFWAVFIGSVILSAGVVFDTDGWRTMHVTHPFFALFATLAFTLGRPVVLPVNRALLPHWRKLAAVLVCVGFGLLAMPAVSRWEGSRLLVDNATTSTRVARNEHTVRGAPTLTGIVVVPDDAGQTAGDGKMRWSEFEAIIRQANFEREWGPVLDNLRQRVPFGFVYAVRTDLPTQTTFYIVPPSVLFERDVTAWRFVVQPTGFPEKSSRFVFDVKEWRAVKTSN